MKQYAYITEKKSFFETCNAKAIYSSNALGVNGITYNAQTTTTTRHEIKNDYRQAVRF